MDQLTSYLLKGADATGTAVMPLSLSTDTAKRDNSPTKTIRKTASVVDVTGLESPATLQKVASRFALPAQQLYPLDSYLQVKEAGAYFDRHLSEFDADTRIEYARNLLQRSEELGIKVASAAHLYGSDTPSSPEIFQMAFDGRRGIIAEELHPVLEGVKQACEGLPPNSVRMLLTQFDEEVGISHLHGRDILDPHTSAFGVKTASEDLARSPNGSIVLGNDYMTIEALETFVKAWRMALVNMYGEDMAKKFQADPVGTFNGLTTQQKKMIMHMVNDNSPSEATSG